MAEEEFDASQGDVDAVDINPRLQELIVTISKFFEEEAEITSYTDGTRPETIDVYSRLRSSPEDTEDLYNELSEFFTEHEPDKPSLSEVKDIQGPVPENVNLRCDVEAADAQHIIPSDSDESEDGTRISLETESVDLIVTSPPYWKKRDYGVDNQLGQEDDPEKYVYNLVAALEQWRPLLRPTGSVFLNIGDTYDRKSLVGIPGRFAREARDSGWVIRNHITWAKSNGLPSSARDRLVERHEHIFHLTKRKHGYYYDLYGYSEVYGNGSNPGDVWYLDHDQNSGGHLAPFPEDLVRRAITLACPSAICTECGDPRERELERGLLKLDESRPQARRALEIFEESDNLTKDHIRAIQATGISDAGKGKEIQETTGGNSEEIQELATEAKDILGGYFREFTFPEWETKKWTKCECDADYIPGTVFDPFAGSGTTIKAANDLGYHGWGTDLDTSNFQNLTKYGD